MYGTARHGLPADADRSSVRRLAAKYRTPLLLVTAYLLMRVVLAFFARG
jgi:hypothetical protein